jgi:hypothetical protein
LCGLRRNKLRPLFPRGAVLCVADGPAFQDITHTQKNRTTYTK